MKCDHCNRPSTVHKTEVRNGKLIETNLCEVCAAKTGGGGGAKIHTPINELLTKFVMAHSGAAAEQGVQQCDQCGMTWAEFRQNGLLGCALDYDRFERDLAPLIQRAHEGATHHVGKTPAGNAQADSAGGKSVVDTARLRRELQRAVESEDYELAAKIRDQIKQGEAERRA